MKSRKNIFLFLRFVLLTIFVLLLFCPTNKIEKEKTESFFDVEKTHTIIFAGDVMLDRGVQYMIEKHGEGDYAFPFLKIKNYLESDVLFGNLESMISDKGRNVGSIYSFRAEPLAIEGVLFAGFNVVSLANNHTFDYTREAFEDTMHRLKENGIAYTGAGFNNIEAHSPAIVFLEDGTRVGFLGYTEFLFPSAFATEKKSGVSILSEENIKRDVENAKDVVDFLVVSFHCGDEYQKTSNEKQKKLSKLAVDYGADIVIGHHPHVTQEIEKYNEKYIAYSLGNFIFDQYFSKETMKGFLLKIKIKNNEVVDAEKIHYKINEFYQPEFLEIEKVF